MKTHGLLDAAENKRRRCKERVVTPYVKATAVGVVTGLLLPVVFVAAVMSLMYGRAATGGGGIAGVSIGVVELLMLLLVAGGFIAGFIWTLRGAKRHDRR